MSANLRTQLFPPHFLLITINLCSADRPVSHSFRLSTLFQHLGQRDHRVLGGVRCIVSRCFCAPWPYSNLRYLYSTPRVINLADMRVASSDFTMRLHNCGGQGAAVRADNDTGDTAPRPRPDCRSPGSGTNGGGAIKLPSRISTNAIAMTSRGVATANSAGMRSSRVNARRPAAADLAARRCVAG
jgi:hypothetical protein